MLVSDIVKDAILDIRYYTTFNFTGERIDENDTLTGVGNLRRIKDVMVLKDGEYIPIDLNEIYTIASHNYMIKEGGCGMLHYLENHELTLDESIADYQVLIDYIGMLNGNLKEYETVQDRIIIK